MGRLVQPSTPLRLLRRHPTRARRSGLLRCPPRARDSRRVLKLESLRTCRGDSLTTTFNHVSPLVPIERPKSVSTMNRPAVLSGRNEAPGDRSASWTRAAGSAPSANFCQRPPAPARCFAEGAQPAAPSAALKASDEASAKADPPFAATPPADRASEAPSCAATSPVGGPRCWVIALSWGAGVEVWPYT